MRFKHTGFTRSHPQPLPASDASSVKSVIMLLLGFVGCGRVTAASPSDGGGEEASAPKGGSCRYDGAFIVAQICLVVALYIMLLLVAVAGG